MNWFSSEVIGLVYRDFESSRTYNSEQAPKISTSIAIRFTYYLQCYRGFIVCPSVLAVSISGLRSWPNYPVFFSEEVQYSRHMFSKLSRLIKLLKSDNGPNMLLKNFSTRSVPPYKTAATKSLILSASNGELMQLHQWRPKGILLGLLKNIACVACRSDVPDLNTALLLVNTQAMGRIQKSICPTEVNYTDDWLQINGLPVPGCSSEFSLTHQGLFTLLPPMRSRVLGTQPRILVLTVYVSLKVKTDKWVYNNRKVISRR